MTYARKNMLLTSMCSDVQNYSNCSTPVFVK